LDNRFHDGTGKEKQMRKNVTKEQFKLWLRRKKKKQMKKARKHKKGSQRL
jgi:hypothetical protein